MQRVSSISRELYPRKPSLIHGVLWCCLQTFVSWCGQYMNECLMLESTFFIGSKIMELLLVRINGSVFRSVNILAGDLVGSN